MNKLKKGEVVTTTMSKAYQITVPSVIRKFLRLAPGDPVDFKVKNGNIVLVKAETHEKKVKRLVDELEEWRNSLPDEVKDKIKEHAGWTVNQYHEYYDNLPETKAYLEEKYGVKIP